MENNNKNKNGNLTNESKVDVFNSFKSNSSKNKNFNYEQNNRTFQPEKKQIRKPEEKINIMDISNFPKLKPIQKNNIENTKTLNVSISETSNVISLVDRLKNQENLKEETNHFKNDTENELKRGWICIQKDDLTNQIVWNMPKIDQHDVILEDDPLITIQRWCEFNEKRKNNYIKNWGFEEYDKMFLFQNYDYGYYDNIDDAYETYLMNHYHDYNNYNNYNDYYDELDSV